MDKQFDVVIVGTGVAGLYGALKYPEDVSVLQLKIFQKSFGEL